MKMPSGVPRPCGPGCWPGWRNFIDRASGDQALPRLRAILAEMHDQLSSRWPEVHVPEYPALARPGSQAVPVPDWWPPRRGQKVDP